MGHKIVFYVNSLDPCSGGVARVTHMISSSLMAYGWTCYAIVWSDMAMIDNHTHYTEVLTEKGDTYFSASGIVDFCRSKKIDVLVNTEGAVPHNLSLLRRIKLETDTRIVSCCHSTPLFIEGLSDFHSNTGLHPLISETLYSIYKKLFFKRIYKKRIKEIFRLSQLYIVLDKSYVAEFIRYNGITERQSAVRYIHNPSVWRDTFDWAPKRNIVLYVGRLSREKHPERLLEIWNSFYPRHRDWKLLIVGDGPMKGDLELKIEENEIKNVLLLGNTPDIDRFYKVARLILLTSDYEGWPMSIVEAMGHGVVPIVYDTFSALHVMIVHGKDGYIVGKCRRRQFPVRFTEYMEEAIKNYSRLSQSAHGSIQKYNIKDIAKEWEALLQIIVK